MAIVDKFVDIARVLNEADPDGKSRSSGSSVSSCPLGREEESWKVSRTSSTWPSRVRGVHLMLDEPA